MALLDSSGVVAALNISFSAANCVINVGPKFGQRNPQHGWVSATPFLGFLLFIHTLQMFAGVYGVSAGFLCNISFSAANCVINVGPKFGQRNPQHGWVSATPFLGFLLFIHTYFNLAASHLAHALFQN